MICKNDIKYVVNKPYNNKSIFLILDAVYTAFSSNLTSLKVKKNHGKDSEAKAVLFYCLKYAKFLNPVDIMRVFKLGIGKSAIYMSIRKIEQLDGKTPYSAELIKKRDKLLIRTKEILKDEQE
jgi:hypothetical protein